MARKNTVNEKRLTKKQVSEVVNAEGKLHQEYTKFFEEKYSTGYIKQDKVYELPNNRYLYVFDEKNGPIGGKGDIYTKNYFLKSVKWHQRVRDDSANNRSNSVDHWRYYSSYKTAFIDHVNELVGELTEKLGSNVAKLDYTYESLDVVSKECQKYQQEELFAEWYDLLVAYVGEVIIKRVNGFWKMNSFPAGDVFPSIGIKSKHIIYMPINVVWQTIGGIEDINFRKQTANEIRRHSWAAKFDKDIRGN